MSPTEKLQIDLPIVLPSIEDERDQCVDRLIYALERIRGVEEVHINGGRYGKPFLCIHFSSAVLSIQRVREIAMANGAEITSRYQHFVGQLSRTVGARRAKRLEAEMRKIYGILDVHISPVGVISIEFERSHAPPKELFLEIQNLLERNNIQLEEEEIRFQRFESELSDLKLRNQSAEIFGKENDKATVSKDEHDHSHAIFGEETELIFSILAACCLLIGWLTERAGFTPSYPIAIYLPAYLFGGYFAFVETFKNLRVRKLEIDSLMIFAAVGAAILGEWPEGALLLVLFSLGHALEHYAMGKARRAVEALATLAPKTARIRTEQGEKDIPIDQLQVDDVVIVRPNERLSADGFVIKGESAVDQSPVTGESVPVDKMPVAKDSSEKERLRNQHRVFAGTINGFGNLEIQVTKRSSDTTLSNVIQMVNEAEAQKSPTQLFTDRFERFFVPAVLMFIAILPFAFLILRETWQESLYRAMSVLVAASPCALAIATPSAVLSAVARAARGGVLIKGGAPLEELGRINAIAFDKTGTLTKGTPQVTEVLSLKAGGELELLHVASKIEKFSDHPIAEAIVKYAGQSLDESARSSVDISNVRSITGKGIQADYGGEKVLIGKHSLFENIEMSEVYPLVNGLAEKGRTIMIIKKGDVFMGVIGLMDKPRETASTVIKKLRAVGVEEIVMLSGDSQNVANEVAKEIGGMTDAKGDLMPEDKVKIIRELRMHREIAMVGDGVNDAPAMTQATVGIAMGAAGSDVALQTADIALMSDDLRALPFAVELSRKSRAIIKQNLIVSLAMVAFLIPATLFGLKMGLAVIGHEGSTLLVVLNALRLLAYRGPGSMQLS